MTIFKSKIYPNKCVWQDCKMIAFWTHCHWLLVLCTLYRVAHKLLIYQTITELEIKLSHKRVIASRKLQIKNIPPATAPPAIIAAPPPTIAAPATPPATAPPPAIFAEEACLHILTDLGGEMVGADLSSVIVEMTCANCSWCYEKQGVYEEIIEKMRGLQSKEEGTWNMIAFTVGPRFPGRVTPSPEYPGKSESDCV